MGRSFVFHIALVLFCFASKASAIPLEPYGKISCPELEKIRGITERDPRFKLILQPEGLFLVSHIYEQLNAESSNSIHYANLIKRDGVLNYLSSYYPETSIVVAAIGKLPLAEFQKRIGQKVLLAASKQAFFAGTAGEVVNGVAKKTLMRSIAGIVGAVLEGFQMSGINPRNLGAFKIRGTYVGDDYASLLSEEQADKACNIAGHEIFRPEVAQLSALLDLIDATSSESKDRFFQMIGLYQRVKPDQKTLESSNCADCSAANSRAE